jgi:hypothetical protein
MSLSKTILSGIRTKVETSDFLEKNRKPSVFLISYLIYILSWVFNCCLRRKNNAVQH